VEPSAPSPASAPGEGPATGRLRVAIFGGSFNPPHIAHLFAAVYALATAPVDRVLVVPVFRHPFAKELAPFEDRLAMCRLGLGWVPGVEISTVEQELGGESLTLRTVEHLSARHPGWALRLLIGADVLPDLPKWHRFDRIAELAPPLVLGRSGFSSAPAAVAPALDAPPPILPRVSSTEIRAALAVGDLDAVQDRVPAAVLAYVEAHRLYAHTPAPGRVRP
jgi:nicotinate-nucleotide adenylyltransferase